MNDPLWIELDRFEFLSQELPSDAAATLAQLMAEDDEDNERPGSETTDLAEGDRVVVRRFRPGRLGDGRAGTVLLVHPYQLQGRPRAVEIRVKLDDDDLPGYYFRADEVEKLT